MQFVRSRRRWPRKLTSRNPKLMTVGYRVAGATEGRVVVDYKQNAWGQTLASIYPCGRKPLATVSTPVTWKEVEGHPHGGLRDRQRATAGRETRRSGTAAHAEGTARTSIASSREDTGCDF